MMNSLSPKALFSLLLLLSIPVNGESISVSGITKRKILTQSSASSAALKGYQIRSFIDGSGFGVGDAISSASFMGPGQGGTLTLDDGSLDFESQVFPTQGAFAVSYPDGGYTLSAGGASPDIVFEGNPATYPSTPIVTVSAGTWQNGKLVLSAAEISEAITFSVPEYLGNGFVTIELFENSDDGGDFLPFADLPNRSSTVPANQLQPGMELIGEAEFDNVVFSAEDGLATTFAIYSTRVEFEVVVVENLTQVLEIPIEFIPGPNRTGVCKVMTEPGFRYSLVRSSSLGFDSDHCLDATNGDGTEKSLSYDDSGSSDSAAFFRIERTEISELRVITTEEGQSFVEALNSDPSFSVTYLGAVTNQPGFIVIFDPLTENFDALQIDCYDSDSPPAKAAEYYYASSGRGFYDLSKESESTYRDSFLGMEFTISTLVAGEVPDAAGFATQITGKTIRALKFTTGNRWESFGNSGDWSYEVTGDEMAVLTLTFDGSGNDAASERSEFTLNFGVDGSLVTVESSELYFENNQPAPEANISVLDLTENSFAPFSYVFEDILRDQNLFDGSLTFSGNRLTLTDDGETYGGTFSFSEIDDNRILLVLNYDQFPEDPTVYRDEATFNFNGTNSIPIEFREYEDGELYDSYEISFTFNVGG